MARTISLCSDSMRLKSSSICAISASSRRRSFVTAGLPKFRSCHSREDWSCCRVRAAFVRLSMGGGPPGADRCASVGAATDRRRVNPNKEQIPAVFCLFIPDLPDVFAHQYISARTALKGFVWSLALTRTDVCTTYSSVHWDATD